MSTAAAKRIPRARRHIIERPRITRLLDETNARTILLVAPAGFGKTTLARQWLDSKPHGWYRGSAASSDVAALAAGIAKAAGAIVPGAGGRMMERLGISGAPPPTAAVLATMLGEDLADWPDDAWLAVDDYHLAMESEASETFVEELIVRCPVRLLVTSRARPTWATARKMLYGEILEVGRSVLALTHEEAKAVLGDRKTDEVAGLMSLTEGWPAVIGLASLSSASVLSEAELPDTLYDYCAEELFQKLPDDIQVALCTIAQAPSISDELLRTLFGKDANRIAHAAEEAGFITRARSTDFDTHPLLRSFLVRKLEDLDEASTARSTSVLTSYLINARLWDDALAVAIRTADPALLEELIDAAIDELLSQGRLETLKDWVAQARARGSSPVFDLAEAEVAFREGDHAHALLQATNAASQLPSEHHLTSRAWFRASQSAHFMDHAEEARELGERALETATNPRDTKAALWGLFNAGLDLEDPSIDSLLREMEALRPLSLEEEIRVAGGGLTFAGRRGGLERALAQAQTVLERLSNADPVAQTGFLNAYCSALTLSARYEEAWAAIDLELQRARAFSVDFVVPYALLIRAWVAIAVRRFAESERSLRSAHRAAAQGDIFVASASALLRAKTHIIHGRPDQAIAGLAEHARRTPIPVIQGELLALNALALALLRRYDEALAACEQALHVSASIETRVPVEGVRAVVALSSGSGTDQVAREAFRTALEFGNIDSLTTVYRGYPALLPAIAADHDLEAPLWTLLARAHDVGLARQAGLQPSKPTLGHWQLTKREEEVLTLLAQGLTNKKIAERLFLAEVTVKVHVRHIFEKLGVRSRTEAAVRATIANTGPD